MFCVVELSIKRKIIYQNYISVNPNDIIETLIVDNNTNQ